jgi:hypothetical protein
MMEYDDDDDGDEINVLKQQTPGRSWIPFM